MSDKPCEFCKHCHSFDEVCYGKLQFEFALPSISRLNKINQNIIELEKRITRIELFIRTHELFVQTWSAKAISGEYKLHQIQQGQENKDPDKRWRDLTDDEKLQNCFRVIDQHVDLIVESTETLVNHKTALSVLRMTQNSGIQQEPPSSECYCGAPEEDCALNRKVNGVHLHSVPGE